jgi:hemolysin III
MEIRKKLKLPAYTKLEEIFNSVTHGLGVIALLVGGIFLFKVSTDMKSLVCYVIYVVTSFSSYCISAVYHALPLKKVKYLFRKFDHCSIFLFIAGTYTPVSLLLIKGKSGVLVLTAVWIIAVLGIVLNLIDVNKFAKLSLVSYLTMGWISVFTIKPLLDNLSVFQLAMLFAGGIAYTIGAVIYVLGKKIKYMHSVWHLFVLLGSVFHFILVYSSSLV